MASTIDERIEFGDFKSPDFDLYLVERDAPTPKEKEILQDVPFMQGSHDFSMMLGERIFDNRTISYEFVAFKKQYPERKILENKIKDILMSTGYNPLYDTHDADGFWWVKCESVKVDDDAEFNKLRVQIDFTGYPYFKMKNNYFDDVWDTFNFDYDVACFSKYYIDSIDRIEFFNAGSTSVSPVIYSSSNNINIVIDGQQFVLNRGVNENYFLKLKRGLTVIDVYGKGEIVIYARMEIMR